MSLTNIKAAVVTALDGVASLKRAYSQVPEQLSELPCAFVRPVSGQYQTLSYKHHLHNLEVTLIVQRVGDITEAQEDLDAYLDDSTGADSIVNAIESSTTYSMRVTGYRDYGGLRYADTDYIGVKFDLEVIA